MRGFIKSPEERATDALIVLVMVVVSFVTLYPFYNVLIQSLNDPIDGLRGGIFFWPRQWSIENYKVVLSDQRILQAVLVTVSRTVIGTVCSVLFTAAFAFALSKRHLMGRKVIMAVMLVTMYFNGGLIPYYLLIKALGLQNNFLVYIIPLLFNAFNAIILMTFFRGIPGELEESAKMDGANELRIFVQLILPVSTPVLATIALYNGVAQWNSWFDAMLYGGKELATLQQILVQIINSFSEVSQKAANITTVKMTGNSVKLATMVITVFPIACAYPWLQRYFVKGIMIGSLKG